MRTIARRCSSPSPPRSLRPRQAQEPPGPRRPHRPHRGAASPSTRIPTTAGRRPTSTRRITSENSVWTDRGSRAEMRVARHRDAPRRDHAARHRAPGRRRARRLRRARPVARARAPLRAATSGSTFATPHARFAPARRRPLPHRRRPRARARPRVTVFAGEARIGSDERRACASPPAQRCACSAATRASYVVERAASDAVRPLGRWRATSAGSRPQPVRYVSPDMTGYEDLDRYGAWSQEPDYGALWYPDARRARLGAVSLRPLGLRAPVGLDLGRRRAVGLRAVPLRPLGVRAQPLGAGTRASASRVPCGRPRWSRWVGGSELQRRRLRRARPPWAGIRSRRGTATSRGTARARRT